MKKHLFLLITIFSSLAVFAQEDTLNVIAHNKTNMVWHVNYDRKAYFPTEGKKFRKIYMYYTLGCASGGCSHWDYDVLAQLMHNTGNIDSAVQSLDTTSLSPLVVDTTWRVFNVLESYELGRLITPYGNYMDYRDYPNGANGFDSSWKHTFRYDVTDYASLLKDSVIIRSKYNGWSAGFSATIRFEFIEGTPQREVIAIKNVYTRGGGYQNSTHFETNVIPPKELTIPEGTKSAQVKVIITGHGNNDQSNCGEFCDKDYYLAIDGEREFTYRMWREDCGNVPVRPQGGTYLYPRANWCPGDKVHEQRYEITPFLGDSTVTIDLDIEPYTNRAGGGGSSHNISTTAFFYAADHYGFDAEINTIIAPSTFSEHINYNPSCGEVIVVIKNNSHTPLTYAKIEYGPQGGKMRQGEWEGELGYEQMDTVYLPSAYWNGIDDTQLRFVAKLLTPNHRFEDHNSANDIYISDVELAPRFEPIRLYMRSNGQPQENKITITDQDGNVVHEKSGFSANAVYDEDINLPNGCYTLTLSDAGGDGLHWWVYAQTGQNTRTNGFFRIMKQGGGTYANVNDFGSIFRQNFIVGEMSVPEAPLDMVTNFDVFPNPSMGKLNVLIPKLDAGMAKISVIDAQGKTVLSRQNSPTNVEHWEQLEIRTINPGIYMVIVEAGDHRFTQKILHRND